MSQKKLIILMIVSTISHFSFAQSVTSQGHFELEADPIAYVLQGYSAHIGYQARHFRYEAGTYSVQEPSFFSGYDNFNVRSHGAGVKVDYLLKERKGFLVGFESDISSEKVSLKSSTAPSQTLTNVSVGVRVGYRWMLGGENKDFKGLYIFPWVSLLSADLNPQKCLIQGQKYEQKTFSVFPTVHIGYSF